MRPPSSAFPFLRLPGLFLLLFFIVETVSSRGQDLNTQEQAIFSLLKNAGGQHRTSVALDPILCRVARAKAADMADRGYYDHTDPSGHGPNWLVRQAGYSLPDFYDQSLAGNNIESITAGRQSASDAWSSWMNSAPHRTHLLGENSFYAAQTSVGIGYVNRPGSQWTWYWVVVTAPPSGPSLSIKSPAQNARVETDSITISGSAGGKPLATKIQVRLDGAEDDGGWADATGTASWSAIINGISTGTHTLQVRSLDDAGAVLKSATRQFRKLALAPLQVTVVGNGSIKGLTGNSTFEVGKQIQLKAQPAGGWLFAGWSGGLTTTDAKIQFTMPAELQLTATFVPNPFIAAKGAYLSYLDDAGGAPALLNLKLTARGLFTGKVRSNGKSFAFRGTFDAAGSAQVPVTTSTGTWTLSLSLSSPATLSATLAGDGWSQDFAFSSTKPSGELTATGQYTLALHLDPSTETDAPGSGGSATARVNRHGRAIVIGTLADGKRISAGGQLTSDSNLPIYLLPYKKRGLFAGVLNFREQDASDVDGVFSWTRPASSISPAFSAETTAIGHRLN